MINKKEPPRRAALSSVEDWCHYTIAYGYIDNPGDARIRIVPRRVLSLITAGDQK